MMSSTLLDRLCHFRNATGAPAIHVTYVGWLPDVGAIWTSPYQYLREESGDCPSEFVIWESDLFPGTEQADISRQQVPWTSILWWTVDWSLHTESCSLLPVDYPQRVEGGTMRKRVTKYKAHGDFWDGRGMCRGIHNACGNRVGASLCRPWTASSLSGLLLSKKILSDRVHQAQMFLLQVLLSTSHICDMCFPLVHIITG